jgi:hypothetical protein
MLILFLLYLFPLVLNLYSQCSQLDGEFSVFHLELLICVLLVFEHLFILGFDYLMALFFFLEFLVQKLYL